MPRRRRRRAATSRTLDRTGHVVVVGGGAAAGAAVEQLRVDGFAGSITVLCGEPSGPYDRTTCSKGLLDGRQRPSDVLMVPAAGAHWRLGERAVSVDPAARTVTGSSGLVHGYDGLIIASGTTAAVPPGWSPAEQGILRLRTLNDAWTVRRTMRRADRVAIIGGGFTGCELACGLLRAGRRPVIIERDRTLMHTALGTRLGALVTAEHREMGTAVLLDREVLGVGRRRGRFRLTLDSGEPIDADLVVLATGQRPDTDWLEGTGFDLSDGILCDEALRVVGGDGSIVAAGSVARWPNAWYGGEPMRCAQWVSALEQGAAAARSLLAGDADVDPVCVLPRAASHQYRLRIQSAGRPDLADEVELTRLRPGRHSPAGSGVVARYKLGGVPVAVAAVNAPLPFGEVLRELAEAGPQPVPEPQRARHRRPEPEPRPDRSDQSAPDRERAEPAPSEREEAAVFAGV